MLKEFVLFGVFVGTMISLTPAQGAVEVDQQESANELPGYGAILACPGTNNKIVHISSSDHMASWVCSKSGETLQYARIQKNSR